ncbi:hypothetical protein MRX96_058542 [Rhipicephalus microplus]|uniref:Uncharacterized protein n=1 Tax=Rhipicephalus microplus TaxID=6941 RepID=A0A9J6DEC1_RHIMP|nr:hypothetical protein HPB51_025426 [Rhipicephalus microplus]
MNSLLPNCKPEKGDITNDAEELGDYDARTAIVPRPPAKPFGIEVSSSSSRTTPTSHTHKCRRRVNNNSMPGYFKRPLSLFNAPRNQYNRNSEGHPCPPFGGGLRSAVLTRPLAPSCGCGSLPSFMMSHNYGRTSGADDWCGGRKFSSHLDHCLRLRRSYSGDFSWDKESSTASSSSHGRFHPPSMRRL